MSQQIDTRLRSLFAPDAIRQTYTLYKKNKTDRLRLEKIEIPMGADGITYTAFEAEVERNARNISRRVLTDRYIFYPLRELDVLKPDGGVRTLSIASIRDVLVQHQLYETLYPIIERIFRNPLVNHVSFAYRKGYSAPQAALYIHKYLRSGYLYALDADIVKYFDRIPRPELLSILASIIPANSLAYKLTRRFVSTDKVPYSTYRRKRYRRLFGKEIFRKIKPQREKRNKGVPQGGVLLGMLANLYLHQFDLWVMSELKKVFDFDLQYVRYADDFVILVKDEKVLPLIRDRVAAKLAELKLELHTDPNKTRFADISKDGLDFVGFHFTSNEIEARARNIKKFKDRFTATLQKDLQSNWHYRSHADRLRKLITRRLNYKVLGLTEEICPICGKSKGGRPRSWMGYFSVVTQVLQLRKLDKWMREQIYSHFRQHYHYRIERNTLREAGLASIEQEYYRLRKRKICRCKDIDTDEGVISY